MKTYTEMVDVISDLQSNPQKLNSLSNNAVTMASRFDWKNIIKDWESVIEKLYKD